MEVIFSLYSEIALWPERGTRKDVELIRLVGAPLLCSLPIQKKKIILVCGITICGYVFSTEEGSSFGFPPTPLFLLFSCFCFSLWKAISSPKHARHLCVFWEENKANPVETFHIFFFYMDDIQVWKAKDRLLFIVKFPRKQTLCHCTVLGYHSQSFSKLQEWEGRELVQLTDVLNTGVEWREL